MRGPITWGPYNYKVPLMFGNSHFLVSCDPPNAEGHTDLRSELLERALYSYIYIYMMQINRYTYIYIFIFIGLLQN